VYAIAGVGALVTAAIAYNFMSGGDDDEEDQDIMELLQEKGLDDVKKNEYGMLDPKYFLELLQFVGE